MATNYVKASYTEVIDLQTTNGETSIIGIHTPVGVRPYRKLQGFFSQFRKYRYKGISSLVMVPAANLPVDPLGLTGVVGTTDLMDPRDALNPILFHGAHGEHLSEVLDQIYSADEYVSATGGYGNSSYLGRNVSDSASESLIGNTALVNNYYKCLTDTSWRKFGIQSGVRLKGLHPLVWKMARNAPLLPAVGAASGPTAENNNATMNAGLLKQIDQDGKIPLVGSAQGNAEYDSGWTEQAPVGTTPVYVDGLGTFTQQYVQDMTNGVARLGWLPTTRVMPSNSDEDVTFRLGISMLPKVFMGVLVLPPSYNVEQYFRMVIRHEFEFSGFTSSLSLQSIDQKSGTSGSTPYFNWIDYSGDDSKDARSIDSVGDTLDMIGGKSDIVSDGVA